jgi:hypothetical protein
MRYFEGWLVRCQSPQSVEINALRTLGPVCGGGRLIRAVKLLVILFVVLLCVPVYADELLVPFFKIDATQIVKEQGRIRLETPGCSYKVLNGKLTLPVKEYLVLLPENTDTKTLKVELRDATEQALPGTYDPGIAPVSEASSPSSSVAIAATSHIGRYLVAKVTCWPYRYDFQKKQLIHTTEGKMSFVYDTIPPPKEGEAKPVQPALSGKNETRDFERLTKTVLNWQQVYCWYDKPGGESGRKLHIAGPRNALLILTTSAIQRDSNKFADFVAHKRKMGFRVDVVSPEAWGGGKGALACERIRAYLQQVYRNYHYLLIIADPRYDSQIPMKKTYPYWFDAIHNGDINTDYYYAELTGNWDLNGNGYFGEWQKDGGLMDFGPGGVDLVPELIVGRIPYYGVPADLDKILAKTIRYETMPSVGAWAQRVLIPMKPYSEGEPSWMYGEPLKDEICLPFGLGYYRVYDAAYDCVPAPEAYPCTEDAVLAEWKKGYGFVLWGTHGGDTGASWVFSSGKAPLLDDSKPSFVFAGSCFNAQPETKNNLAYSLLLNGAIVTAASTRMSGGALEDGNIGMEYWYAKYLIDQHMRCGDAFWQMMLSIPIGQPVWNNHCSYVLYGDPTVAARWPTSFSITTPAQLRNGEVGKKYGQHLFAAGGKFPYQWSLVKGALPAGLILSTQGFLSGTPTQAGSYAFALEVRMASGKGMKLEQEFVMQVEAAAGAVK